MFHILEDLCDYLLQLKGEQKLAILESEEILDPLYDEIVRINIFCLYLLCYG